jgi:sugar phosphate permease
MGFVLLEFGWRWSFALTGFMSALYFLLFWRMYRDPDDEPRLSEVERRYIEGANQESAKVKAANEPASSLFHLLANPKVLGLAIGFGSYNYVFYLLLTWLPSYLSFGLHLDQMHSFVYTSVPWLFATFTDLVIGGWLVDLLLKRGWSGSAVRRTVLIGGTTFGLGIFGAAHTHSTTQALIWISISIGGLSAASPVGWSLPSLIAARNDVGKVGGIINFSNQISGIAAPIVTGYLVSVTHSYVWVFRVAAVYLVIGIAAYIFLLGKIERPGLRSS